MTEKVQEQEGCLKILSTELKMIELFCFIELIKCSMKCRPPPHSAFSYNCLIRSPSEIFLSSL